MARLILFGSGDLGLLSLGCHPATCRCGIGVDIFIGIGDIGNSIFVLTAPTHTTPTNDNYYRGCVLDEISITHMVKRKHNGVQLVLGVSVSFLVPRH